MNKFAKFLIITLALFISSISFPQEKPKIKDNSLLIDVGFKAWKMKHEWNILRQGSVGETVATIKNATFIMLESTTGKIVWQFKAVVSSNSFKPKNGIQLVRFCVYDIDKNKVLVQEFPVKIKCDDLWTPVEASNVFPSRGHIFESYISIYFDVRQETWIKCEGMDI